jgi:hypothetical protein
VVKVLNGDLEYQKVNKDSIMASEVIEVDPKSVEASEKELELREKVAAEERAQIKNKK